MNLIMLTNYYPYGSKEAFIENEIGVMSKYYKNIFIITCQAQQDLTIRAVPNNVKCFTVPEGSRKADLIRGLLKKRSFLIDPDYCTERAICNNPAQKIVLDYFEEKSRRIFKYIQQHINLEDITSEPFVLYSYWLFVTSRVGLLLSERYHPILKFTRAHRYDLYEEESKVKYLPYRKLFLEEYDYIFPCSINGAAHLYNAYPECKEKVKTSLLGTLDHGINTGSADGIFRIVSCSRVESVKRIDKIVKALAILEKQFFIIEWTHIGGGTKYEYICELAGKLLKRTKFYLLGNKSNDEVMKIYQEQPFDLFVNTSRSEGLPVSIMEAMSFGIPCLATNVGGTSEIVKDNYTGKLIRRDFEDVELSRKIADCIEREDMLSMRNNCRVYWEDNFKAIPNYQRLYEFVKEQSALLKYEKKKGESQHECTR